MKNSYNSLTKEVPRKWKSFVLGFVYKIRELLSFRNEFRSRIKFALHSQDKIDCLSRRRYRSCQTRYAWATRPRLDTICDFQSGTNFVFSLRNTRMKSRTRAKISFGLKTGKMTEMGNKILFRYHVSKWWEMQRWNQLVPEWKSFRYHVNSPLRRVTCMASRSMHILMSHFCDTQMGGICHIFFITLGCSQVHLNQTYNHLKLTLFFTGFWGMSWISKYWRCKDCLWWYVSP